MVNVCVDPRREEGVRVFSWVDEMGLSLIQETVVEKHNELQAIPEVLDSLDLSGAVVSIDAMEHKLRLQSRLFDQMQTMF